jgi:hypothetical protein
LIGKGGRGGRKREVLGRRWMRGENWKRGRMTGEEEGLNRRTDE